MGGEWEHRIARRRCLQTASVGAFGLTLPRLLQAEAARPAGLRPSADACIILFLDGGPSHLDMWDMKPEAAAEIRGPFQPIDSTLAGEPVSEHLPRVAKHMHRGTLIRSAHHSVNNAHAAAVYTALTGHDRGEKGGGAMPDDYPAIGSVMGLLRPPQQPIVPFVSLPYITKEGAGGPPQPGFFGGLLGKDRDPLFVLKDPNAPDFSIPELALQGDVTADRLTRRRQLRQLLEGAIAQQDSPSLMGMHGFQERAFSLLSSPATQQAFQLSLEPETVRTSYGRNIYGQSVLLARRLIEAGTRVVTVSWAPDANATWDTHGNNFGKLQNELLPQLDAALASLLDDLAARNRLDRTIVAVMGDFGRTPKVNGGAGRDHWNFCYSLMLFGGGFRQGYVHGASDKIGAYPADKPITPAEIIATVYHALGIEHTFEFHDTLSRPYRLIPWGEPLSELLA
jgi:hypothetical protein